jgi:hypothetical protein
MKNFVNAIFLFCLSSLMFGCSSFPTTMIRKVEYAPNFYANHPKSILVLPAINTTSAADAADHFRYTITKPLAEQGYYVFPVHLVDSFFKSENLPDAELIRNIPVKKLKEIFQTDAILYVDILNWDTDYSIVKSSVDVGLHFSLIDANSEEEIWQGNIFSNSSSRANNNDASVFLISLIDVALNAGVDYTDLATEADIVAVNNFPYGVYQNNYQKDQKELLAISESPDPTFRSIYNPTVVGNQLRVNKWFMEDKSTTSNIFGPLSPAGSYKLSSNVRVVAVSSGIISIYNSGKAHHIINSTYFKHSDFKDYYYYHVEKGKKYLRHRFFLYENNRPFLISSNKKVFVKTNDEGNILYTKLEGNDFWTTKLLVEPNDYGFEIDEIINLSSKL